jgi:O-antigen/teichoic acid export membrane protein
VLQRLKALGRDLAVYGAGDIATQAISFLLLPLYVRYLSPGDYGVLALLLTIEVAAKIVFRWGVDASFMRMYYDCPDQPARQRLSSTIFFFLLAANGVLLALLLAGSQPITRHLFGSPAPALALQLLLVNTFLTNFFFIPFHELRIQRESPTFISLTIGRSLLTIVLRLTLVIWARLGILGVILADLIATAVFALVLLPRFARLIRPAFSIPLLREALRFGLPRLPHGVAQQTIAFSDRYVASLYVTLHELGLYTIGASFAMGLKLFLNAFEFAWAPFYFSIMREPDAKATYRFVATWTVVILCGLGAMIAAGAEQIIRLMTTPVFHGAAAVVPWIVACVVMQGIYLVTSIGLNITKRTEFYPIATATAAGASLGANFLLIPGYGIAGAAAANVIAYAVLAALSARFAHQVYPVGYEWTRMLHAGVAAMAGWLLAVTVVPSSLPDVPGLVLRAAVAAAAYATALAATGFITRRERAQLPGVWRLFTARRRRRPAEEQVEVSETTEIAGQVVSATAGEPIEGADVPQEPRRG